MENRPLSESDPDARFSENDFKIHKNTRQIPLTRYPSYTQCGLVGLCLKGSAKFNVHSNEHLLVKDEIVIILPGQLVSMTNVSDDFAVRLFIISNSLFDDILSGICRFSPHFFFYMRNHYYYKLDEKELINFENYFEMIYDRVISPQPYFKKEYIVNLVRIIYLDLYNSYKKNSQTPITLSPSDFRKRELSHNFFSLIMQHYKENRTVAFYADTLCITPKYLTMVIKEASGKSAKDWITEYIILEIKSLLKDSALSVQEIAVRTNFPNQSSLGRFFRKHTGMSPMQYRENQTKS